MKPRSKFREVIAVSIPSLLLLLVALYFARVEAVSKPGGSHMFISKVELSPASGLSVSEGTSHYLEVTVGHPWPRPKWWGHGEPSTALVHALSTSDRMPAPHRFPTIPPDRFTYLASGGAVTWTEKGHVQIFKPKKASPYFLMGSGYWKDGNLVFSHALPLQDLPVSREPLTFHGVYFVEGEPPLRLNRVIRQRGETLKWNNSRDTGGKVVSFRADPFIADEPINVPWEDICNLTITVSHPPRAGVGRPSISDYDWELVDGHGHVLKPDQLNIIMGNPGKEPQNTATTTQKLVILEIKRAYATIEPLTLRAKISIDDHWPIPISVRLLPRSQRVPWTPK